MDYTMRIINSDGSEVKCVVFLPPSRNKSAESYQNVPFYYNYILLVLRELARILIFFAPTPLPPAKRTLAEFSLLVLTFFYFVNFLAAGNVRERDPVHGQISCRPRREKSGRVQDTHAGWDHHSGGETANKKIYTWYTYTSIFNNST